MTHTTHPRIHFVLLAAAAALLGACAAEPPKPPETAARPAAAHADATPPAAPKPDDGGSGFVRVDQRVVDLCRLPEPHFAFDSAALTPHARRVLDAIASCFKDGPGKGKSMKLVGHADPRGETIYNFGLGQHRAGSVATYLARRGLEDRRLAATSRGALDATGTNESTWAEDRRVDILLAN